MWRENSPPLFDLSEDQLREDARKLARDPSKGWSYDDFARELDRRAANRLAYASLLLSIVSIVIAVAAVLIRVR
jgi:hypothetical protein